MIKKIVFIPGWMYSPEYFKLSNGINIWKEDIDFNQPIDGDCFVGHSMGAAIALRLWSADKNKDLILVNPFIEQKSILKTIINRLRCILKEGVNDTGRLSLKYFPKNFIKVLRFPEENYWKILQNVPKEKIKILHGSDDVLCNEDTCMKFRKLGLEVIEVPGAGHDWHKNFDDVIKKIA